MAMGAKLFNALKNMSFEDFTSIGGIGKKTATKFLNGLGNGTITAESNLEDIGFLSNKGRTGLQSFLEKSQQKNTEKAVKSVTDSKGFGSAVTGGKNSVWDDIERGNIMSGNSEHVGGIRQSENDMVKSVRDTTYDDLIESTGVNPEALEDTTDVEEFVKTKEQIAEEKIKKKNEYDALKAKREEELNNYDEDWNQKIFDASVESSQATFSDNAKEAAAETKKAAKKEARRQKNEEYGEGFNKYRKKYKDGSKKAQNETPKENNDDKNTSFWQRTKKSLNEILFNKEKAPKNDFQAKLWNEAKNAKKATYKSFGIDPENVGRGGKYRADKSISDNESFNARLYNIENVEQLQDLLKESNIKVKKGETISDAAFRTFKARANEKATMMDNFMGYHGPGILATGAIGFAAIKAADFGGPKTNAQLYGNPF